MKKLVIILFVVSILGITACKGHLCNTYKVDNKIKKAETTQVKV